MVLHTNTKSGLIRRTRTLQYDFRIRTAAAFCSEETSLACLFSQFLSCALTNYNPKWFLSTQPCSEKGQMLFCYSESKCCSSINGGSCLLLTPC